MKKIAKRAAALLLALTMTLSLFGCGSDRKQSSLPNLEMETAGRQNTYDFSAQPSPELTLSAESAAAVLGAIEAQQADYAYAKLYELEQVKSRLDFDASVAQHRCSALNEAGQLDAAYLAALVAENNSAYLQENTFGYEDVEADYLLALCKLIIRTVEQMRAKYPDVDWQRVYCNLGNLKILYDVGMLSYAEVSGDQVLSISKNNTSIVEILEGENGFRNVLIHETMHIIQIGCACEQIENCNRRAGICVYWDDFTLNTTDWAWMLEGSAERNMCNLTGDEAISYQYKMDYLCSFTMSVLLRDEVEADTMETLCFYSDPELLFGAFGCETEAQRDEVLKLMITMNILQMQPSAFYEVYEKAYGSDPRETDETLNQFSYSLKPAVCVTLAKEFYENLVAFTVENGLTANDLFFLLTLFEGHLNQHLTYSNESKAQINAPFVSSYTAMRQALFAALEAENPELNMDDLYASYEIITPEEGLLNADLSMLPQDKRDFLAERAQWQAELNGLGVKLI